MASRYHSKREVMAEKLLGELAASAARVGDRIDSVRKLSARFGASPVTVKRMLEDLAEQGILRQEPRRGLFVARALPRKPRLGYAGPLPTPDGGTADWLLNEALHALFDHFKAIECEPVLLGYHELADGRAEAKLAKLDGVLLAGSFCDGLTAGELRRWGGRTVVVDHNISVDALACGQVMTDFRAVAAEFLERCDWRQYRRILIVHAGHNNARPVAGLFKRHLAAAGAPEPEEMVLSGNGTAEMAAFRYFAERKSEDWSRTLIFSLSGLYSQGIYTALAPDSGGGPDILSFDNQEARRPFDAVSEPYFTAVERHMPAVYRRGVDLLCEMIQADRDELVTIGVPAELVRRKSIRFWR